MELKSRRRPEASTLITPSATLSDTFQTHGIQRHSAPPAASATIAINLSDSQPVCLSRCALFPKAHVFQLSFRLRKLLSRTPTRLMTPVPCNFFSVANCDYRVGVELLAEHHLSQLLSSFCCFFLFSYSLPFLKTALLPCVLMAASLKQCLTAIEILKQCWTVATEFYCPGLEPERGRKLASLKCA